MNKEKTDRLLRVPRNGVAECNKCGQKFTGEYQEALAKFRQHNRNEDASQAAARIVKEATEGH
jgi:NMD protein affecting ribosome stability and mRNA decay